MATQAGLSKSNISSADNTLANPSLSYYKKHNPQQSNVFYPQTAQSAKESLGGHVANYNYDQNQDYNQYQDNYQEQQPVQYSLDDYKKNPEQDYSNQNYPYQDNYQQYPPDDLQNYLKRDAEENKRIDMELSNKQAYKKALDQQVAEKELMKHNYEKSRIKTEIDSVNNYPFGRRQENNLNMEPREQRNFVNQVPSYQPSFHGLNNNSFIEEPHLKLNKDNIVEKPNSLVADVPFYDPVKHRSGYHQGYNYDPWGKPGAGAPLIDSNGRKFTKYTGQVWYDTLGLTFDDRAKYFSDKNRPSTLEEQKQEMESERQRRRMEQANYKGRTGDLATWITDLENKRVNKIVNQGAHLNHTNVTREKINLEYARKTNNTNIATRTYHDELGAQLEERNRANKLYKLKDDVAGIEHTRKWDDWWGKPGGGAPNPDLRRRDLKETLESPRENRSRNSNFEGTSLQVGSFQKQNSDHLLYAKGTVKSNHRNLYDNLQAMKL